jgi:urease accessory protein
MKRLTHAWIALAASGAAAPAFAHPFYTTVGDFAAGYTHAFLGLDHLLAMFAVGLWAMRAGGRALVRVPLLFCGAIALGIALAGAGLALPGVEPLVAASVLALGLLLTAQRGGAPAYAVVLIAIFGLLHGFAHGASDAPGMAAIVGLLLASVTLHAAGAATAFLLDRRVRACGVALMGAGAWLLAFA